MPALPNTFFSGVGPETLNGNWTGSNDGSITVDNFIFLTVGILIGLVLYRLLTSTRSWLEYGNLREPRIPRLSVEETQPHTGPIVITYS
ncbi:hypothetical protein AOXY_G16303 [Acipenser oxyrinchus oxyrinchus]|uniref:Uncharacterized protein n=1 Tax=Acipenser oxyrinchus oxyrinchus TaxID=40147 RepID=A0AAD8G558_ACIOX|nr:hypothetical protein AOXY_G16303 [Acipenser oxyrinchus oxyrinchus]